jgi:hypothetical protein
MPRIATLEAVIQRIFSNEGAHLLSNPDKSPSPNITAF